MDTYSIKCPSMTMESNRDGILTTQSVQQLQICTSCCSCYLRNEISVSESSILEGCQAIPSQIYRQTKKDSKHVEANKRICKADKQEGKRGSKDPEIYALSEFRCFYLFSKLQSWVSQKHLKGTKWYAQKIDREIEEEMFMCNVQRNMAKIDEKVEKQALTCGSWPNINEAHYSLVLLGAGLESRPRSWYSLIDYKQFHKSATLGKAMS